MKRLLLVDGSSYLYRAFHAMPDLRNRAGEPTGAIYGVVNMLRRLRADFLSDKANAHCSACVFDAPGPTFRDAIFPQYKANRSSMPEDLAAQIPHIHEVTRALGWPVLQLAGIEADDIIGTLACMALAQDFDEVVISTGDKDMAQLVNDRIRLVDTMKNVIMTRQTVFEKFGVYPERIVDYLSLMGDTSDNVPGVDGVGPKTAAKWIAQYGSLDAIVEQADGVAGKVGEKLRLALPWLPTARTLVTIKTNCDLSPILLASSLEQALPAQAENTQALIPMFARFEFKTWLRAATGDTAAAPYAPSSKLAQPGSSFAPTALPEPNVSPNTPLATVSSLNTVCINTEAALHTLLADLHQCQAQGTVVAFDTETTSLHAMQAQLVGIALAWQAGTGYYIPLQHQDLTTPQLPMDKVLDALRPWLENPQATLSLIHI
jgi:DNA polymerase-1